MNLSTEGYDNSVMVDNYLSTFGANYSNSNILLDVMWGDGTSDTYSGTTNGVGMQATLNAPIEHHYSTFGTYNVLMVVSNPANGSNGTMAFNYNYNCTTNFYGFINNNCDNNTITDFPLTFIGQNMGDTISVNISNGFGTSTELQYTDIYNVSVSQWWLTLYGYTANITPNGQNLSPGGATTYSVDIECDTLSNMSNNCVNGVVFCDENGNGIFDGNDMPMPNAVVEIQTNGQTIFITADGNGNYNSNYSGNTGNNLSTIQVHPYWLSANGFSNMYSPFTFTNVTCSNNGATINVPMSCDSSNMNTAECVSGWVFCDANGNGILDPNESGLANAPILIYGVNGNIITVYTDQNGVFSYSNSIANLGGSVLYTEISTTWLIQNGYTILSMQNQTVQSTDCNNPIPRYFALNCNPATICADLWSNISPWIGYYQNYNNTMKLTYGNNGPGAAQSYTLSLTFPIGVTPVLSTISNPNYVIAGNTITWNLVSGSAFFNTTDFIQFTVPPGIANGTGHVYTTDIIATGNNVDCNAANNTSMFCLIVGNSYDPNDKAVNAQPIIDPSVDDELVYIVRFQNTGTAPAQDIYVLDTLSTLLDWSTFELLDATHYVQVIDLGNGLMKFDFPNIWLPDSTTDLAASQGSFTYKIKENSGNGIGTEINNTAYIYFDQNPAIVTNTTMNVNNVLGIDNLENNSISTYPNPVKSILNIESVEDVTNVKVYDQAGRLVIELKDMQINTIDFQHLNSGIYMLIIDTDSRIMNVKIIKE